MNTKKVINHFMMDIMDETYKAREQLKKFIGDAEYLKDEDESLQIVDVCLQNICYYARIIIENEDAL